MRREDRETRTEADARRFEADQHVPGEDLDYDPADNTLGWDGPRRPHNPDPDPEFVAAYHAAMQEARRRRAEMDGVA